MHRIALLLLSLASPLAAATDAERVRIYRCSSSAGVVALQNTPCNGGRQRVLDMQRPKDPPAGVPRSEPRQAAPPLPVREVRIVKVQPPQPMYECIAPDGKRYNSDTAEGRARAVPLWSFSPPARPHPPGLPPTAAPRPPAQTQAGALILPYARVMVRDECHALPQREVCARLNEQRWTLIRRYHNAMTSERKQLTAEQRGIEARIEQDCDGS